MVLLISILTGVCKPPYNVWGPHIVGILKRMFTLYLRILRGIVIQYRLIIKDVLYIVMIDILTYDTKNSGIYSNVL